MSLSTLNTTYLKVKTLNIIAINGTFYTKETTINKQEKKFANRILRHSWNTFGEILKWQSN
jgi:hypothetical protein